MTQDKQADLVHDVAKYVARVAMNVSGAEDDKTRARLLPLLLQDLYGSASARFNELGHVLAHDKQVRVKEAFAAIARIESALRRGEKAAFYEACEFARQIATEITGADVDEQC